MKLQQFVDWKVYNVTPIKKKSGYRVVRMYADGTKMLQQRKQPAQTGTKHNAGFYFGKFIISVQSRNDAGSQETVDAGNISEAIPAFLLPRTFRKELEDDREGSIIAVYDYTPAVTVDTDDPPTSGLWNKIGFCWQYYKCRRNKAGMADSGICCPFFSAHITTSWSISFR